MANNLLNNLINRVVCKLSYSVPFYDMDLVSDLAERIYRFETLGAYSYEDPFLPEEVLERALEDFETDMQNMLVENTHGEKHYFARDVLEPDNWKMIAEWAEDIFWEGANM